jgi:hypothetical protein
MNPRLQFVLAIGFAVLLCSTIVAPAKADLILNGDFATGTLDGWTVFTTANGTNGSGLPDVVPFNTTGFGTSNSAHFNVGDAIFDGTQQGGGIFQTVNVPVAGFYDFSAAIASNLASGAPPNFAGGVFSVLINGTLEASVDLGPISTGQTLRDMLSGSVSLTPGNYDFEIEITRPFATSGNAGQPNQYVTDISLTAVPEPSSLWILGTVMACLGLVVWRRSGKRIS